MKERSTIARANHRRRIKEYLGNVPWIPVDGTTNTSKYNPKIISHGFLRNAKHRDSQDPTTPSLQLLEYPKAHVLRVATHFLGGREYQFHL